MIREAGGFLRVNHRTDHPLMIATRDNRLISLIIPTTAILLGDENGVEWRGLNMRRIPPQISAVKLAVGMDGQVFAVAIGGLVPVSDWFSPAHPPDSVQEEPVGRAERLPPGRFRVGWKEGGEVYGVWAEDMGRWGKVLRIAPIGAIDTDKLERFGLPRSLDPHRSGLLLAVPDIARQVEDGWDILIRHRGERVALCFRGNGVILSVPARIDVRTSAFEEGNP